jgi:hypothetical protein
LGRGVRASARAETEGPDLGRGALAAPPALRRAARWDGIFPIELPAPEALIELVGEIAEQRGDDQKRFDVVVDLEPGTELDPWRRAGATWILTDFGPQPRAASVEEVIEHGPQ